LSPNGDDDLNRVLGPEADVLSYRDKKGRKETLPLTLRRQTSPVPSFRARLKGFADGTSMCRRRTPGSLPGRFAPAFRLRTSLGLRKGVKNQRLKHD